MEPGIPKAFSRETLEGHYNLDPAVSFWATPPVHGCLRESVVHPARFCFKLPPNISPAEGAMIEPLAIGVEAAKTARIEPGDTALVIGAGTIGIMCMASLLASGCSTVYISDIKEEKLKTAAAYGALPFNTRHVKLEEAVMQATAGRGVDVIIEASGSAAVYPGLFRCGRRGGRAVLVGMMNGTVPIDTNVLSNRGLSISSIFRYTNCFDRALALLASGKIDVRPLISRTFRFDNSIAAYEYAAAGHDDVVKVMIELP
jgi:D-xylulose reductase